MRKNETGKNKERKSVVEEMLVINLVYKLFVSSFWRLFFNKSHSAALPAEMSNLCRLAPDVCRIKELTVGGKSLEHGETWRNPAGSNTPLQTAAEMSGNKNVAPGTSRWFGRSPADEQATPLQVLVRQLEGASCGSGSCVSRQIPKTLSAVFSEINFGTLSWVASCACPFFL